MELKELYEQYGKLMIELEILNSRIIEIKRKIAEAINQESPTKSGG